MQELGSSHCGILAASPSFDQSTPASAIYTNPGYHDHRKYLDEASSLASNLKQQHPSSGTFVFSQLNPASGRRQQRLLAASLAFHAALLAWMLHAPEPQLLNPESVAFGQNGTICDTTVLVEQDSG